MLVISPIVVGCVDLVVERLIVRCCTTHDRRHAGDMGLSLLLIGIITLILGNTPVSVPTPIPGYQIGHYQIGGNNLFVIAVAVLLMCAMGSHSATPASGLWRGVRCG